MDDVKDYRIEVRLKNNRILRLIERSGHGSVAEFCRAQELDYGSVVGLIGMKAGAFLKSGDFRPVVIALARTLGVSPYDLFNDRQADGSHEVTFISREVDAPPPTFFADNSTLEFIRAENLNSITTALGSLDPRIERMLRMKFGLDGLKEQTLEEIGRHFRLTRERVRQQIIRGLETLKYSSRHKELRAVLDHEMRTS